MSDEAPTMQEQLVNAANIATREEEKRKDEEQRKEAVASAESRIADVVDLLDLDEDVESCTKSIAPQKKRPISFFLPLETSKKVRGLVGYNGDLSFSAVIKKLLDGLKEYSTDNPEQIKQIRFIKTSGNKVKATIGLTVEEKKYIKSWIGENGLTTVGDVIELAFKIDDEKNL